MPRLLAFENLSIDGYFADANGDVNWAHAAQADPEFAAFVSGNAQGGGMLLFGRRTYDIMVSFWPTPAATQSMPDVAEGMNRMPKVVFSRTLTSSPWNNTSVVNEDIIEAVRNLKAGTGPDMCILGSGTIVSQLAGAGLIDEIQLVVNPIVLGAGKPLFTGLASQLNMTLTTSRTFKNGNVLHCYAPK